MKEESQFQRLEIIMENLIIKNLNIFEQNGIEHELCASNTPQNGLLKEKIRLFKKWQGSGLMKIMYLNILDRS